MPQMLARLRTAIRPSQADLSVLTAPRASRSSDQPVGTEALAELGRFLEEVAAGRYGAEPPEGEARGMCLALAKALAKAAALSAEEVVETAITANELAILGARLVGPARQTSESAQAMAAAAQEMTATIAAIEHSAGTAADAAQAADSAMQVGLKRTDAAFETIVGLGRRVQGAAEEVRRLGETSQEIGGIVASIDRIAAQTRLLALNATIEAARAGEAGKGVAVVAKEVNALAQQTARATDDIRRRISELVQRVQGVVATMATAETEAQRAGAEMDVFAADIRSAGQALDRAVAAIREIARSVSEQTIATNEIAANVACVADLAKATEAAVETMASSFDRLDASLGRQLGRVAAAEFPTKTVILAKADHVMWKRRLVAMAAGRLKLKPEELADHQSCRLGKWFYGAAGQAYRCEPGFAEIEPPHIAVHEHGRKAAALFRDGDVEGALREIAEVENASVAVLEGLDRIRQAIEAASV
jgi:methyl-accepting chemotaxis protein